MGIKQRHSRDREAMRRAILQAARELFVREGYENVSIRKIAKRIGYSPAAIYLYFAGKDDIFYALAEDGFRRFTRALADAGREEDPLLALEHRFWRYYEFSQKQPEYFWLMFVDRSVPRISRDWERFAFMRQTRAEGAQLVRACVDAGLLPAGTNAVAAFHVLGAAIHGAAVIHLCGRMRARRDANVLARDTLRAAIAGLRAGVALDFSASFGRAPQDAPLPRPASHAGPAGDGAPGAEGRTGPLRAGQRR